MAAGPADDDAMLAPAPDVSVLGHTHRKPIKKNKMLASIGYKQTLIPILLTTGLLAIAFGLLKTLGDSESPYSGLPTWLTIALYGMGAVLLGSGIVVMFSVKAVLDKHAAAQAAAH